ncbi:MAG: (d)CMP kinase [Bacteroidales bacterium]|nr:(d)CMP kinase [Bacteroidales bacterium]MBR4980151.1 (d)CMP kinase [Bacteroidales bacterium]MBR5907206.1 (d)CMP kinase [Bacteroidales bacterium]
MASGKIIIAIDGYSSTGKSSFAKLVAKGLGYIYADSGALYRAITYFAYTNGFIDEKGNVDKDNLQKVIMNITVSFRTNKKGESRTLLNGTDVERQIRTLAVSNNVSRIAEIPYVRSFVNMQLRSMAVDKGLVMDGRDIGTAVFPNAELKIFMTASEQVRAMRRFKELQEKGEKDTFEQVLENLRKRDYIDSHRETDPLTRAKDAIELDNSSMTMDEEIEWLNKILLPNFNLKVELDKEE